MAYKRKEVKERPGPKPTGETGKTYRVYIKPSTFERITQKHKTLSNALNLLDVLENKKDKTKVK